MQNQLIPSGCACCLMNRRNFLAATGAAGVSALGFLTAPSWSEAAQASGKIRIRVIYALHAAQQPGPDWPNKGFDFQPVMDHIQSTLSSKCPGFEFVTSLATGEDQAKKILEQDRTAGMDGYLVYQMNCWNRVVQTIATSGKPVLYADFQYGGSGGFLVYNAAFLREKSKNVGFVASSEMKDLVEAVKCFAIVKKGGSTADFVAATAKVRVKRTPRDSTRSSRADAVACIPTQECVQRMKASKILAFRGQEAGPAEPMMGIPVVSVPFAELNDAWKKADKDESRAVVDQWTKTAAQVVGVSREVLEQSAAMYLAQKAVMKKHGANAITINCLGGFYGGHIQAYPCLGFHQLLNEGLIGACECDVRSTATMVAIGLLTQGRPGYISDPVIDTSKRQIIYAHCVASNRAFGPQGSANPFQIMTHSEDRQGASVRSKLPTGYLTTTLEITPERKEILFHRARAVDNVADDRACRTKLAGEPVGDIEKLFTEWDRWGWHRVTFYGDLKEPVFALADAIGWKIVEEA
jgi:hypothetical protein